jgi:hypothetical protein
MSTFGRVVAEGYRMGRGWSPWSVLALGVVLLATCSKDESGPGQDAGSPADSGVPVALPDGGAVKDGGPTDAGGSDGGAPGACSGLLGAQGDAGVFTPPRDPFVQPGRANAQCHFAASDRLGRLAFVVQQGGGPDDLLPGDAWQYVVDAATNGLVTAHFDGGTGLWSTATFGTDEGFVNLLSILDTRMTLTWFDHQGLPTALVDRLRTAPEILFSDAHGRVVAAFGAYDDPSPTLHVEAYDVDGGTLWSDLFPDRVQVVALDWKGRTLLSLDPDADGGRTFGWIDATGDAGPAFGVPAPPLVYLRAVPRLEGGFFLAVPNNGFPQEHFVGALASGATELEPVPAWLQNVDPRAVIPSPTGRSYMVLNLTARGADGFGLRSAAGDDCAHVELPFAESSGNGFGVFIGLDGTVLRTESGHCLADAGPSLCPCGWEFWPQLLR